MSNFDMSNSRQWCIVCGNPRGDCIHVIGFTSNTNEAYRIWLAEQERLKKLGEQYSIRSL